MGVGRDVIDEINAALNAYGIELDRAEILETSDFGLVSDVFVPPSNFVFGADKKTILLRTENRSGHVPRGAIVLDVHDGTVNTHDPDWSEFLRLCEASRGLYAGQKSPEAMNEAQLRQEVLELREQLNDRNSEIETANGRLDDLSQQVGNLLREAESGLGKRLNDYLELVRDASGPPDVKFAWASAEYARDRARQAQAHAREEKGKSFGHSPPHGDGRQFGRLRWEPRKAVYEGETDGVNPHGYGVLTLERSKSSAQLYEGQFIHGVRAGFGVAEADDCRWQGAFQDDQPHGFGVFTQGVAASDQPPTYQGEYIPAHGERQAKWLLKTLLKPFNLTPGGPS